MNNDELKEALKNKKPVIYTNADGVEAEYKCVSAIIYRWDGEHIVVSAEITDKNGKSITICKPDRLRMKKE